jgi:hypothetical protein
MNRKQKRFLERLQRRALPLLVAGAIAAGNISVSASVTSSDPDPHADDIIGDILRIYGGGGGGGGWTRCSGGPGIGGSSHIEFWAENNTLHFMNGGFPSHIGGQDGEIEYSNIFFQGGRSGPFSSTRDFFNTEGSLPSYMEAWKYLRCDEKFSCPKEPISSVGSYHDYNLINPYHECFKCKQQPCQKLTECFLCINCNQNPCEEDEDCFYWTDCKNTTWMNTSGGSGSGYTGNRGAWNGGGGGDASVAISGNTILTTTVNTQYGHTFFLSDKLLGSTA